MSSQDELPQAYVLRFTEYARRNLDAATVSLADSVSVDVAIAWREGLYQTLASLASFPRRCPRAPEKFQGEVRQLIYKLPGNRVSHRILFAVTEADAFEVATVTILHIRHGSARPLTRVEARRIERYE